MKKAAFMATTLLGMAFTVAINQGTAHAATSNWQKSVMIQSRGPNDFGSDSFNKSVSNALADNANYIVLVVPLYQSNIYSTDVQAGWNTPTDQALTSAINYIHSKGVHAAISVHDDSYDDQWRAFINPFDRSGWFSNYGNQLRHYAGIGRYTGTEEMVLGTEMTSMTSPNINGSNTSNWTALIQSIRGVFSGSLTYSAQHDGYMSDLQSIGFWQNLDYIGVSAYYGLGYDSSVGALVGQWNSVNNSYLMPLANRLNKPILFTEIGYASKAGTLSDPGTAYSQGGGTDVTLQANAYQALFNYWNNYSCMAGVAFWDWSSDPNAGGTGSSEYTPQNKPAEQIMKQAFAGQATGGMGGGSGPVVSAPPTSYTTSASVTGSNSVASLTTVNANVSANANLAGALVDVEIYNSQGQRVNQNYYQNQSLSTSPANYAVQWTSTTAGTYSVKVGVFTANWQTNLTWNDSAASFIIAAQTSSTPPPIVVTPTPPIPPTPPVVTPTLPVPVVTNTVVTIWWPGSGIVSGVQPFKALIDGRSANTYTMYWQVDDGGLNTMADSTDPIAHKESAVDLSSWHWNASNQYTINFVAKDLNGNVIGQQSQVITVGH